MCLGKTLCPWILVACIRIREGTSSLPIPGGYQMYMWDFFQFLPFAESAGRVAHSSCVKWKWTWSRGQEVGKFLPHCVLELFWAFLSKGENPHRTFMSAFHAELSHLCVFPSENLLDYIASLLTSGTITERCLTF